MTGIQIFGSLTASSSVTRVLICVHGTNRSASSYLRYGQAAAKKAGVDATTRVLAPWFKTKSDKPSSGEPVWSNDAWKQGGGKVSSFAVMDDLIARLDRFPNLERITLVGHSAGGQFVQRYAIFGRAPESVHYVVANPSSYCYLSSQRPSRDGSTYTVPKTSCSSYNRWKYGLDRREGYVADLTAEQARERYTARRVTILNGADDDTHAGDLDRSCAANLQGPHRLARGQYFHARHPSPSHDRVVVPGVGHDAAKMLAAKSAWPSLFWVGA